MSHHLNVPECHTPRVGYQRLGTKGWYWCGTLTVETRLRSKVNFITVFHYRTYMQVFNYWMEHRQAGNTGNAGESFRKRRTIWQQLDVWVGYKS